MKIAYLMQEGVPDVREKPLSGVANHVVSVIRELKKAGHQVRLLAKMDGQIYWSDDLENFVTETVEWDRGIIKLFERAVRRFQADLHLPYANLFESLRFAYACRHLVSGYDICLERMGWLGYGSALMSRWLNIPLILEVNGDHLDEFASKGLIMSKGQNRLSCFLMRETARSAAHAVATGQGWRQKHIDRWGVAPSMVSVIENGSAMVDILQRGNLRSFKPVERGEPIRIVYCGSFEVWHGIPVLIRAARKALDQGCKLQVTLIGSGAEENNIRDLIRQMDLEKYFGFAGHLDMQETARLLAQSDVGASPYCSRAEFSGLKLLDYKAAGLATIASGRDGQPDILVHGHTGWIVPPCDETAFCEAILTLSRNPELLKQMGQKARQEAERLHSWTNTAALFEQLFTSILSNKERVNGNILAQR
jgi:glycosyltransferase involved in cell wall biosynthesis